jgi:type I restriction-modification system DNA methylase subunit
MPAPESIKQLVERFEQHYESYRSSKYNETQLRREFLDPFFEALGWDVLNKLGYSEENKHVIHEDSLEIEGAKKAPDYAFKIGVKRKFFVEAKKPFEKIETKAEFAFQLKRYVWSAKLPLGILTDFEEFAVYECRSKPKISDSVKTGRVMLLHYKDYIEKWDELVAIFSHEAVMQGKFDAFANTAVKKKGTAEIDSAFLDEIEGWRNALATKIALRNKDKIHSETDLNYAVQMTIDRIIFLRICEERGYEPEFQLQDAAKHENIYAELKKLFLKADRKYNSGLFHFTEEKGRGRADDFTTKLEVDDAVLKSVIKDLYYPSPYVFSQIPADILGQIYEQFLGKVIRLTQGGNAKVEEKPEVRKAGGVFYTPTFIVEYIVKNTVGKLLENLLERPEGLQDSTNSSSKPSGRSVTPVDAAKLKIVDPACGSGTFLLGAYQYLLDWHLNWYLTDGLEKWSKGKNAVLTQMKDGWKLTVAKKKEILLNNIYGVDLDPQAVEVTKLSLLLKVIEDPGQLSLLDERILPDLGKNIQCGNSLVAPDYWDGQFEGNVGLGINDEERARVNAFDWKAAFPQVFAQGGFDAVIGNPPYRVITEQYLLAYLNNQYKHQDYQKDLYMLFLEQYKNLLEPNGLLGVIVSNTWLQSVNLRNIRKYLTSEYSWIKILHLPEKVFKAVVDTHVLLFQKTASGIQENDVVIIDILKNGQVNQHHVLDGNFIPKNGDPINIVANPKMQILFQKITQNSKHLEDFFVAYNGVKPFEIGKGKPPQTEKITKEQSFVIEGKAPNKKWSPLLRGGLIQRYRNNWNNDYWILYGEWLAAPRDPAIFDAPKKIMVRQTGDSIIATIIESGFIARNNMHVILPKDNNYQIEYLLGLMNSKFMDFAYSFINPEKGEALAEVKKKHIEQLPIRLINFDDPADAARHDKMVALVERMLSLHKSLASAHNPQESDRLTRDIESTDRMIDELVYELYGLTEEEIKIVENKT